MQTKITVNWHNPEKTIVLISFPTLWTWQDLSNCLDETDILLESVSYDVYTIFDFTASEQIPSNALSNIRQLNLKPPPNQDKVAIVGLNSFGRMIVDMFTRLYGTFSKGTDVKIVPTIPAAYSFFGIEMTISDDNL